MKIMSEKSICQVSLWLTWGYYDLPGSKGGLYRQGTYGDVKLLAGAYWTSGAYSGSRSRNAAPHRWSATSSYTGRGQSEPR